MPAQTAFRHSISKFSAKPPGYDAARQRENQRRHRARVKEHISDLEEALASTQGKLDAALKQIEELNSEIFRLRNPESSNQEVSGTLTLANLNHAVGNSPMVEESIAIVPNTSTSTSAIPGVSHSLRMETFRHQSDTDVQSPVTADIEDPSSDCPSLPPPRPRESTITCRDAYAIIQDRNTPELDSEIMNQWLKPGFRRAILPGSGCRVETHVLFAFLDHITST